MNIYRFLLLPLLAGMSLVASCEQAETDRAAGQPMQLAQAPASAPAAAGQVFTGKIIETMDAASYTYVQLDTGNGTIWAAGPQTKVELGTTITVVGNVPMTNFHSDTLKRDFDVVYFVGSLTGGQPDDDQLMQVAHSGMEGMDMGVAQETVTIEEDIPAVEGGLSIAALMEQQQDLADRSVKVRGKVTKYTPAVMGKDWIHIRDSKDGPELTITTMDPVALGNQVVVEGVLSRNRDYGYGYTYDVIIEDAKVTVE